MHTFGIVAEYNPFHSGHQFHMNEIKKQYGNESKIICIMSGNWVQRGDCAICDKWSRAHMALQGGADLVIELPTIWAAASAEHFAKGAISLLTNTGIVDTISFGSELGEITILEKIATFLNNEHYIVALHKHIQEGLSFPVARQRAVSEHLGDLSLHLTSPNNTLGIEYIKAIQTLESPLSFTTVKRQGVQHDSEVASHHFASASFIRKQSLSGNIEQIAPYLDMKTLDILQESGLSSLSFSTKAVLARLRGMEAQDFSALPDSGEGLHNLLHKSALQAKSLDELYTLVKSKRYTHSRVRRLVLWAFLGLTEADRPSQPPYLRVLGMNQNGSALLKQMKQTATLPILTKPAHIRKLSTVANHVFHLESRATALFDLCHQNFPSTVTLNEFSKTPIIYSND